MSQKVILKKLTVGKFNWLNRPIMHGQLKSWLIQRGSLTLRLQRQYTDFEVKPLSVKFAKPMVDEAVLLHLPANNTALIREVLLMGNANAVIFAHSVLSKSSLRGVWNELGTLGNKSLGTALFANPKVIRTPLSYKKLYPHQVLYQKAVQHLSDKPAYLWARRSVFNLNCATILVTEVFLPNLLK